MTSIFRGKSLLALVLMLGSSGQALAQSTQADLILYNGTVITPQGSAEAVAVRDGAIVAVGTRAQVMAIPHAPAAEVDLAGNVAMPGLYDSHVHLYMAGRDMLSCKFARGSTAKVIFDAVRACAAKAEPGAWIEGGSWVAAALKPGDQTLEKLDAVSPNNPVILNDESLHSAWVNSRALKLAGITRDTPNPEGGVIDRDARGDPTGVLRETATELVEKIRPAPTLAEQEAAVKAAADLMLSLGIVGLTDAGVRQEWIDGLTRLAAADGLKQYTRGCIIFGPNALGGDGAAVIAQRRAHEGGRVKLDCVKLFLDGVPLESHTASMLEPYVPSATVHGHGPGGSDVGIQMFASDELNDVVTRFDRMGMQIKFHAAGDGSVRQAANAIAAARKANGYTGARHDIGHNTFIAEADLSRATQLNFTWEMSPYFWWPTPISTVDIANAVGPERMKRLWPVKDALDSGALVVAGSDWPVVPTANPWLAIETLVSRQSPGANGDPIAAGQRITREQAVEIFTRNGAAYQGRLDRGGTIEVGKMADIIVIDRNPLTAPIGTVHDTQVLRTYIAGELVYTKKD